jgi:ornithine cyclodeaminase
VGGDVLILREAEIRALLDPASCIQAVEEAFTAYATGKAELPGIIHLDVPESRGEIHIKAGHLRGGAAWAVKIASGFPGNPERGLPVNDGMVLAFDAATGAPAALLFDGGFITDMRTAAAGAVAAKHLARREVEAVAVIGTGAQARVQVELLARVREFREVRVWGRHADRARACAADLARKEGMPRGCRIGAAASAREAVAGADLVVTVTASREPLVRAEWLSPGVLVTAVGSDGPDKQELEPAVLARADRIVADSLSQCLRLGEIHHAVAAGAIGEGRVSAELGEITSGRKPGRASESEIIVCDLTGVGVQDVAAACLVLERARARGLGERFRLVRSSSC